MDFANLFDQLKYAEDEDGVEIILRDAGYLTDDPKIWQPVGEMENNFAAIGNQQSDPTGALVEKIVNSIDAMLMAACFNHGVDPESTQAPQSMVQATERFFGVSGGRLSNLSTQRQRELAENINFVAVGSKKEPSYLIIDRGEGQTPAKFPATFLSLMRSNKIRIPFVQGKFNSGGTGVLQFCGEKNYQLIASRRQPGCPVDIDDSTRNQWGFTLVRRLLPSGGRRNSMYVYLAPNGQIPSFDADAIRVLPGKSAKNQPAVPYAVDLPYGTCIKLYNYRWKTKSIITTDGRYELERFLQSSCLPFRLTETREYPANYYSATVVGGWNSATTATDEGESKKLEDGFPAYGDISLEHIGNLPYQIAVYKAGTDPRHVPYGISFVVNGQVHGALPPDFVTRKLKLDYLVGKHGPLLVLVDCTFMDGRVREDFFMASRDRVRRNEVYTLIEQKLTENLRDHPGLQELNQRRRQQELEQHLNEQAPLDVFQNLLKSDPTLANLFGAGERLVTSTGPGSTAPTFVGRKFPSFFRLRSPKEGQVKSCPLNRTCRVEFETDAVNDYFKRADTPGELITDPPNLLEHSHLWNGHFETRFRMPWDAQVGTLVPVTLTVNDVSRSAHPFVCTFTLKAEPEVFDDPPSGPAGRLKKPYPNGHQTRAALEPPKPREVHKSEWGTFDPPFTKFEALRLKHDGNGGYDYFVNIDNTFLLSELAHAKDTDKPLMKHRFMWGLVLAAVGMLRHSKRSIKDETTLNSGENSDEEDEERDNDDTELVNRACNGLAQVVIPIIRSLYYAPLPS